MFDAPPAPPCHSLMQDPAFTAALRSLGQMPVELPGGLTLLRRRFCGLPVLMLPRADPPDDLDARLRRAGLCHLPLLLSPEQPVLCPGIRIRPPVICLDLPLDPVEEARRAALHGKWRNALRRAERGALRVQHGPLDPRDPVIHHASAQAHARGYGGWPEALTRAWAKAAPAQTRIFRAVLHGTEVAQMVFLTHGARATYHMGLTNDLGRREAAHTLLMWRAMAWLTRAGIRRVDLGPSLPQAAGIDRFKLRAGAEWRATGGTWLRWRPLARKDRP